VLNTPSTPVSSTVVEQGSPSLRTRTSLDMFGSGLSNVPLMSINSPVRKSSAAFSLPPITTAPDDIPEALNVVADTAPGAPPLAPALV